jgi:predicted Zn-dependent peptidase
MPFLLLLLCASLPAQAQMVDPDTGERKFGLPTYDYVFPTGFRVVVAPDDSLPAVGVTMVFDGGSGYEPIGRSGMAHLVEHLWFRSGAEDTQPVMDQLNSLGCQWNAWTSVDHVSYSTACPSQVLARLLQVEAQRLRDPMLGITANELESERAIVQQEGRVRGHIDATHPYTAIVQRIHPPEHPYGHLTIGSREDLQQVSLDDVRAFTAARYRPEHATLVITGDVTPQQAMRLIFRLFDLTNFHPDLKPEHLKRRALPEVTQPDPDQSAHWYVWPDDPFRPGIPMESADPVDRSTGPWAALGDWRPPDEPVQADVDKPTVAVAWMLPPYDPFALGFGEGQLEAATEILAATAVGHLHPKGFGCGTQRLYRGTLVLCQAMIDDADQLDKFAAGLTKMKVRGSAYREDSDPRARRISAARLSNLTSLEAIASAAGGRSERIALHVHEGHSAEYLRDSDRLLAISELDPAYDWLREHLDPAHARVVRLIPLDKQDDDEQDERSGSLTTVRLASVALPKSADAFADAYPNSRIQERTLANGLRVVAIDHGRMPFVDIALYVPSSIADAPPGVDSLANSARQYQQSSGDATLLRRMISDASQRWSAFGIQSTTATFQDAVKDLRTALESLAVSSSDRDWTLERLREQRKDDKKSDPSWLRAEIAEASHLPSWPLGLYSLSDAQLEELADRPIAELRNHLLAKWQPKGAVLVIVGANDVRQLVQTAAAEFERWRPSPVRPLSWTDAREWPPKPGLVLLDDPKADNADLTLTCVARHRVKHAQVPTELLGTLLSQDAFQTLRMEHGLTYSPGAWSQVGAHASQYAITANVAPDRVPEALRLLEEVLARGIAADYTEEQLEDARVREVIGAPLQRQTRRQVRNTLGPMLLDGWSLDDWRRPITTVQDVDHAALRAVIAGCTEERVVRVDGPADAYADALAAQTGLEPERFLVRDLEEERRKEREARRKKPAPEAH